MWRHSQEELSGLTLPDQEEYSSELKADTIDLMSFKLGQEEYERQMISQNIFTIQKKSPVKGDKGKIDKETLQDERMRKKLIIEETVR